MSPPPTSQGLSQGLFLALEGGDGAGKSTQARLLGDWLTGQGYAVTLTREPGGTPLGDQVRQLVLGEREVCPRAEALLFAADRAQHVDSVVRPALERGEVVVSDRYVDSSIAYQSAGRNLDGGEIARLSAWATGSLVPALTVVLDVPPEVGRVRRGVAQDRLEAEPDPFHTAVRQRFLDLAAAEPGRYLVVDATLAAAPLSERVRERVAALLPAVHP